ncbi:MAG: sulfatase/phosphatase domain-containing protein, partial [Pirellulaceae bacterium]
ETSMHAPLIVKAPGMAGGQKTAALTEFIDIYPTLCELAGLDKPSHLQGQSFVPLLKDPRRKWKESAIGRYGAGDTIRTNNFRYSEYTNPNGKLRAKMLYDHQTDPQEDNNIVEQPKVKEQVQQLSQQLETGKGK